MNHKSSIGIFDSGFGGLSILKEIQKVIPKYNYVYLGDTLRAPYGGRSQKEIYKFTKEGIDFLFGKGCSLIILACNSSSSEALRRIQQEYLPKKWPDKKVLGVIIPASEEAVLKTKNRKIGVLGTLATVKSHAFKREIQKLGNDIKVYEVPAPLLVPIVESGEEKSKKAKELIKKYVRKVYRFGIDALILGCTHYGILEKDIKMEAKKITILSEGKIVAEKLKNYLKRHKEINRNLGKEGKRVFYTTGEKNKFDRLGSRFFGKKIQSKNVEL